MRAPMSGCIGSFPVGDGTCAGIGLGRIQALHGRCIGAMRGYCLGTVLCCQCIGPAVSYSGARVVVYWSVAEATRAPCWQCLVATLVLHGYCSELYWCTTDRLYLTRGQTSWTSMEQRPEGLVKRLAYDNDRRRSSAAEACQTQACEHAGPAMRLSELAPGAAV